MSYVVWNKIRAVNGSSEVIGADEPISISDLSRLGYPNAQHAWDCMLAHGDIVPVGTTTAPPPRSNQRQIKMTEYRLKMDRWFSVERPRGSLCTSADFAAEGMDAEGIAALIHNGVIEPVAGTGSASEQASGVSAELLARRGGESDLAWADRLAPVLRARRVARDAATDASTGRWGMVPNPAWEPPDAERALAVALEAGDVFDERKKAEADAASRAAPAPTRAPAPDPSRSWIRP